MSLAVIPGREDVHKADDNKPATLFDDTSKGLDKWTKRNRYYHEQKMSYCSFLVPEGMRILDLGCGNGDLLGVLNPSRGLGIDISQDMTALARRQHASDKHLEFQVGDIEDLDLVEKFDYIILSDVLGQVTDVESLFLSLRPLSHPETRIIISYYNFLWEPLLKLCEKCGLKKPQKDQNWLSPNDIENFLFLADLETVKKERRILIPIYIPFISTLVNRYLATLPGLSSLCLSYYIVARMVDAVPADEYSVSIIIPCRNEKGNIEEAVRRVPRFGTSQELIFVDGHSEDGTLDEITRVTKKYPQCNIKILTQDGTGKGDAVRKGFAAATGDILMILDADLTVMPEDLPRFYRAIACRRGEFINGCRLVYPMEQQSMSFLNLLGNKVFGWMFSWMLNQRFKDTLCGTKVLFRKDYELLVKNRNYFGEFDPFGDFDLIFGASKLNLRIIEVPIRYKQRKYGSTNIHRFRHGLILLRMCLFALKKLKAV